MERWIYGQEVILCLLKMRVDVKGLFSPAILPSLGAPSCLLKVLFGFSVQPGMFFTPRILMIYILSNLEVVGDVRWSHCKNDSFD